MWEIPKEVLIGGAGSILGGLVVYIAQSGWRLTKGARQRSQQARHREIDSWKSGSMGIRQGITNQYLFSILRYLSLGNLLWLMPDAAVEPLKMLDVLYEVYVALIIVARIGALLCFFLGLGSILRYLRLRALDVSSDTVSD